MTKKNNLLLTNKNFILLFYGNLVTKLGDVFYNFAIGFYILDLTSSAKQQAFYIAFATIVYLVLSPIGGALVDRLDRVKVLYFTDFIRGVSVIIAGMLVFMDFNVNTQLLILYIIAFIISLNGALFGPASGSLPPFIVSEEELQQANSYLQVQNQLVSIAGVLFGAVFYTLFGISWIFIINGISYLVSGISETFIKADTKVQHETELNLSNIIVDLKVGLQYISHNKAMLMLVYIGLFLNFFSTPIFVLAYQYLYNEILNVNIVYYAYAEMAFSIGFILMAILLSQKQQKEKLSGGIKISLVLWIPLLLVQLFMVYIIINGWIPLLAFNISIVVSMLLMGIVNAYMNIPLMVILQKSVDKELLGRVGSVFGTIIQAATPIAIVLAGIIIDQFSLLALFVYSVLGFVFTSVIAIYNKELSAL